MNKNKKLVIVGAGEFAMIAFEYFTHDSDYEVVAFCVENKYIDAGDPEKKANIVYNKPLISFEYLEKEFPPNYYDTFVAIPASKLNKVRTRLYKELKNKGYTCATYISSHSFVWKNAKIGENCFIFENNTIQPFVEIGNNVILWSGNHIGHRSIIQDNCFISSHVVISGYCRINCSCFLGVNSTFNDHTSIAKDCILASGSLVTKNLTEPEKIYYGNPAKALPKKSSLSVEF
ncbi:acetyltransferase [Zooshikella sp. RANM57]|uniref:acetyltransferase n=1 Tax=Zooshikella sp. RANM57 TaxID=3425863 RepID=UPI003D6DC391